MFRFYEGLIEIEYTGTQYETLIYAMNEAEVMTVTKVS